MQSHQQQSRPVWHRLEDGISIAVLATMALLPMIEVAARPTTGRGIPNSIPLVQHLTLCVAFLGAAVAARSGRLLAMSTSEFLPRRLLAPSRLVVNGIASAITSGLVWSSVELVASQYNSGYKIGLGIPVWAIMCVLPLGLSLIAMRLLLQASSNWRGRALAALLWAALVAGATLLATPASGLLGMAVVGLVILAALGLPIYAVIGGLALLFFWSDGIPLAAVSDDAYRLTASPLLPAVPLFTLGGYLLSEGGSSTRLLRLFQALFGWMPGGLAVVTTLVLAFFTPLTGASGVTILSIGGLLMPVLLRAGYPEEPSLALVTVSGSIGLLLPMSLPVILYGVTAHENILHLFAGALLPGVLLITLVAMWGVRRGVAAGAARTPFDGREAVGAAWEAKWEIMLPVLILAGFLGGYMTLVEASAVTVLYAFIIQCFVHRDLSVRRDIPAIFMKSVTFTGGFLIILGMALALTGYFIDAEVPMHALNLVQEHIESRWAFLLALNIFLIIVGGLMDIYSAIFVIVPLITPMAAVYGVDGVHLGVIFLANLELGYLTPPMGENLFLSAYRFDKPLTTLFRSTIPLWLILFAGVLLITYVPSLTLGLVQWLGW